MLRACAEGFVRRPSLRVGDGTPYPREVVDRAVREHLRSCKRSFGGFAPGPQPGAVAMANIAFELSDAQLDGDVLVVDYRPITTRRGVEFQGLIDTESALLRVEPQAAPLFRILPLFCGALREERLCSGAVLVEFFIAGPAPATRAEPVAPIRTP